MGDAHRIPCVGYRSDSRYTLRTVLVYPEKRRFLGLSAYSLLEDPRKHVAPREWTTRVRMVIRVAVDLCVWTVNPLHEALQ